MILFLSLFYTLITIIKVEKQGSKSSLKLNSMLILQVCLKFVSAIFFISQRENTLKIMENVFYFTQNANYAIKILLPRHLATQNATKIASIILQSNESECQ